MPGALTGIRVLDFSEYIAGPLCAMLLADHGADVIKVEPPRGDNLRAVQPLIPGESRMFLAVNRGKRGIVADLSTTAGRDVVQKLAATADVLVINFRPGVAERHGLDYPTLARQNPRLIYAANTAFGTTGPDAGRAGFDLVLQAAAGLMTLSPAMAEGELPRQLPLQPVDITAGLLLFGGVCTALVERDRSGRGQQVDTSLLGAALTLETLRFVEVAEHDRALRQGWLGLLADARRRGAPYAEQMALRRDLFDDVDGLAQPSPYRGVWQTADGMIAFTAGNPELRQRVAGLIGFADPRLDGTPLSAQETRSINAVLVTRMAGALRGAGTAHWLDRFDQAGIPASPVRFLDELFDLPTVRANDLARDYHHPALGEVTTVGTPLKLSRTPADPLTPAPTLGQHTLAVLRDAGYDEQAVMALRACGAVFAPPTDT